MKRYVDGFVLPLPKDNIEKYTEIAQQSAAIWKEHGALEYVEAIADDMTAENMVAFPNLVGASTEETVVLAYIVYESREHRDAVNAKVFADPRMKELCGSDTDIFDCKRLSYGGFRIFVSE
ncbi:DUF1428 domain-containing protein [Luteolibacter algae]|uniref:DUF1428 domain-containing protein n=1 Tax=Luteolibacter algae TaxID=454151 RepID=A0ABW5D6F5_9BACT